jgi:hypothetical protein
LTLLIEADASINVPSTEIARRTLPRLGLRQQLRQDLGRDVGYQHKHSAGALNGEQAIGRSRGGPNTKIHALVVTLGNPWS